MLAAIRCLIGLGLLACGFTGLASVAAKGGSYGAVFGASLYGFAVLILGALILSPTLASWVAMPFTRFIDGIYLPGGRTGGRPQPNHRLAEYYYRSRQFDLAIDEYRKILKYHPRNARAHLALLDLYANCTGQPSRAARIFRHGLRRIRKRAGRRQLRDAYADGQVAPFELGDPESPRVPLGGRVNFPKM